MKRPEIRTAMRNSPNQRKGRVTTSRNCWRWSTFRVAMPKMTGQINCSTPNAHQTGNIRIASLISVNGCVSTNGMTKREGDEALADDCCVRDILIRLATRDGRTLAGDDCSAFTGQACTPWSVGFFVPAPAGYILRPHPSDDQNYGLPQPQYVWHDTLQVHEPLLRLLQ